LFYIIYSKAFEEVIKESFQGNTDTGM